MSELHYVGLTEEFRPQLEFVGAQFIQEGLNRAQKRSWEVLHKIKEEVKEGMTEEDGRKLCIEVFSGYGVTKHWHKSFLRFASGTTRTFNDPFQPDYRLQVGDPFFIDAGPVWKDPDLGIEYEGDVGDTFIYGNNPEAEKCAQTARDLFQEVQDQWVEKSWSGKQIYDFLKMRSKELGYELIEDAAGHRVSDFPHHRYTKEKLGRLEFHPSMHLWILEVQIKNPRLGIGAFFEDQL